MQYTEGSIYFVCCGKAHPIDLNVCEHEAITEVIPSIPVSPDVPNIGRKPTIEFKGGNVAMPEIDDDDETFTCADCGAEVQDGQKFCGNCRKELDWA